MIQMSREINAGLLSEYDVNHIENIMSLRKPQKQSVKILDTILDDLILEKNIDLEKASSLIRGYYPIFKDFEHDFLSLAFALATGVGKTKLMGAFITYLYTNHGIRNFFVVAPNLTIYEKLKNDLGNPSSSNHKYVFKGIGCFAVNTPNIWMDDDYKNRPLISTVDANAINIYIFNISKFNSEERKIMSINEYLGQSFFDYLSSLDDLTVIMDESHHYRAKASYKALNSLNPLIGLELTATPQIQEGNKTILFKNVVFEYPLSKAINDGYTRTPYALTRRDIKSFQFNDDELDKLMINDGIKHHENIKIELKKYARNNNTYEVKPFVLIVCRDTPHADNTLKYIKSKSFKFGYYEDKVIVIHSNQRGSEKEENILLLLNVERHDNPIEIVIHVNILKEGWDVNNLYTIIPLRTATSKTLREQTVGRGLRLPYGIRTGESMIDSVTITAHDKFDDLIREAQSGDSIFKADGVIYADYEKEKKLHESVLRVKPTLFETDERKSEIFVEAKVDHNDPKMHQVVRDIENKVQKIVADESIKKHDKTNETANQIKKDIGERYKDNTDAQRLIDLVVEKYLPEMVKKYIDGQMFIPKIKTEVLGEEKYIIQDFDLDMSDLQYFPVQNDVLIKNILNQSEAAVVLKGETITFESFIPEIKLVEGIRKIDVIDYEKCPTIIQKIVKQFLSYYRSKFTEEEVRSICFVDFKSIISNFEKQLMNNLAITYDDILDTVMGIETVVHGDFMDTTENIRNLYESPGKEHIKSLVYDGAKKAVKTPYKFDSDPERIFAIVCESSPEVIQWLRPAAKQFNITYNRGIQYRPDFVVETPESYYLVEVKRRDEMEKPDVLAKKDRAIKYCEVASLYNLAHGYKPFVYLFIPHDEITTSSSFNYLMGRFSKV
jgi:type III restriction enzyme